MTVRMYTPFDCSRSGAKGPASGWRRARFQPGAVIGREFRAHGPFRVSLCEIIHMEIPR